MLSFPYIAPCRYRIACNDWLAYAAVIDDLGREIRITDEMVEQSCEALIRGAPAVRVDAALEDWLEGTRAEEPEADDGVDGLDLG